MAMIIELPNAIRVKPEGSEWTKEVEIDELGGREEDILADRQRASGGKGAMARSGDRRITEVLSRCTLRLGDLTRPDGKTKKDLPLFFEKQWAKAFSADRQFAMIRLRQLSLGDTYVFSDTCPECGKELKRLECALDQLEVFSKPIEEVACDTHELKLPRSGDVVLWRFLTGEDESYNQEIIRTHKSDYLSFLLARRIVLVNGEKLSNPVEYVKDMRSMDRRVLHSATDKAEGGIDTKITVTCDNEDCRVEFTVRLDLGKDFFFPSETS